MGFTEINVHYLEFQVEETVKENGCTPVDEKKKTDPG